MNANFLLRTFATLFFSLFTFLFCAGQNDLPEFGVYTTEELTMKECSFDKSADAVALLDQGISYFDDQNALITERRIRLKILKEKGIERGNVHIPYYSANGFEFIRDVNAVVFTPTENGGVTESRLEGKNIFRRQVNSLYSVLSFALPNVKVGSIIDYQYQSHKKSYAGLRRWEFQKEIPVITSSYVLTPIANSEFAYSVYKLQEFPIDIKSDKAAGRIRFVMHNIPALRDEVYSPNTTNFLQRVNFQFASYTDYIGKTNYTNTWELLSKELLEDGDFGSQDNKDISGTPFLKSLSPSLSSLEKMKAIHNFVRTNMLWNDIMSKFCDDGVKSVLEKKKGTSGGINHLLIALLKSAGLAAYPLLVSERDHGLIDTTYSYLDQFNKVVALVICDGAEYVLDGTDLITPSFMVPVDLVNTIGFLVDKKKYRFVHLKNLPHKHREVVGVQATIRENGLVEGAGHIFNMEYAKLEKQRRSKTDEARYREELSKPYSFLKIDSFSVQGLTDDSAALQEKVSFHYELKKSGNYFLLNASLFSGLNENPFITQYRFTDIDFGTKYSETISNNFLLPESLTTETLPANKKLVSPDRSMSVSRMIGKTENQIGVRYTIEINRERYEAGEYEGVKAFFKEMVDLLNEPVLLKSK